MNHKNLKPLLAAAVIAACMPASAWADGEPPCSSLPNPVYGIGGSAQKPTVGDFAVAFANSSDPFTLIYASPGACFAMGALIDGTPITGTANYWLADGTEQVCTLPITGAPADYGIMGNAPTTCSGVEGLPEGVAQFDGAVLGWNLIVPNASTQQVISSEALYFVYGFLGESQAAPWTDATQIFSRNPTSAAGIAVASAARLPIERLGGPDVRSNGAMVTSVGGSLNPEAAIGFVSGDVADRSRATVRTLAYQHHGQNLGYWPDSTANTNDKINIRDGRYWLWTSTYFYAPVDGSGVPLNENAARFINFAIGATAPTEEVPAFDILVEGSNIPRCAMNVTRTGDYTELLPYTPPEPCHCFYESIAIGESTCEECTSNADCPSTAPVCRFNYCEAR